MTRHELSNFGARLGLACALVLASGCNKGAEFSGPLPTPDGALFVREVYPLMLRDCAFVTCHGATQRFFQLLGPGRARLDPATKPDDPATFAEVLRSYDRALSMLATADRFSDSLLLTKPLERVAGGRGHKGADELGRNVYATPNDAGYVLLMRWAQSSGAPPTPATLDAANAEVAQAEATP